VPAQTAIINSVTFSRFIGVSFVVLTGIVRIAAPVHVVYTAALRLQPWRKLFRTSKVPAVLSR